jgi:hypothetical protein
VPENVGLDSRFEYGVLALLKQRQCDDGKDVTLPSTLLRLYLERHQSTESVRADSRQIDKIVVLILRRAVYLLRGKFSFNDSDAKWLRGLDATDADVTGFANPGSSEHASIKTMLLELIWTGAKVSIYFD